MKRQKININDIFLSTINPRKQIFEPKNYNIEFFQNQQKTFYIKEDILNFKKLLTSEGDYENLYNLLKSLNQIGFKEDIDNIYVIEKNKKYIVIDGNRRIFLLKCLYNIIKEEDIKNLKNIIENQYDDEAKYIATFEKPINEEDINNNIKKTEKKSFWDLFNLHIKSNNYKNKKNFEIFCNIINDKVDHVENSKKLREIIFSNCDTSRKKGKRNWDRWILLSNYYSHWNNIEKIIDKNNNQNLKNFNELNWKEKIKYLQESSFLVNKNLKSDIKSANFIIDMINLGFDNKEKNIVKKFEIFCNKKSVSALEFHHIKNFFNSYSKNLFNKYFEYVELKNLKSKIISKCFDEKNEKTQLCIINHKAHNKNNENSKKFFLNTEKIYKFIIKCFKQNFFNTTGVVKKNKVKAHEEIIIFLHLFEKITPKIDWEQYSKCSGPIIRKYFLSKKFRNKNLNIFSKVVVFFLNNEKISNISNVFSIYKKPNKHKILFFCIKNLFKGLKNINKQVDKTNLKIEDWPFFQISSLFRSFLENISYLFFLKLKKENFFFKFYYKNKNNKKIKNICNEQNYFFRSLKKIFEDEKKNIEEILWKQKKIYNIYTIFRLSFSFNEKSLNNFQLLNKFYIETEKLFKKNFNFFWNEFNKNNDKKNLKIEIENKFMEIIKQLFSGDLFQHLSKVIHSIHPLYKISKEKKIKLKKKEDFKLFFNIFNNINLCIKFFDDYFNDKII